MSAVSPISGYGAAVPSQPAQFTQPSQLGGVDGGPVAKGGGAIAGASVSASQSAVSVSQTSISASVESFVGTYGAVAADNQILGAMLLLLMLEYMQSDDDEEKKGLLGLMMSLLQQQQQASQASGSFMYSSMQLGIESTQMTAMSQQMAVDVYAGGASAGAAPAVSGATGGGVDMVV